MAAGPSTLPGLWTRLSAPWRAVPSRVLEDKIALMYSRMPTGLAMGLVVVSAVCFLLPGPDGRAGLWLWLWGLAQLGLAGLRLADRVSFARRRGDPAGMLRHRTRLVLGAAAHGALWGLLAWFRFPPAPLDQMFLALALAGLAAGGTIFLSPLYLAYVVFVVPLMTPLCLHLMAGGTAMQKTVGVLGSIYTLAMMFASARNSRWIGDALAAAAENEDLVGRLRERKERLEQVVSERTRSLSSAVAQLTESLRDKEQERLRAAQSDADRLKLLQAINEGFGHVDAREVFLYANPAAEKIFGVGPGQLAGRSLLDFMEPEGAEQIRQETGNRTQGLSSRYLCPIVLGDGQRRLLQVNASPLHAPDGQFLGSSAVFEDITERTQAEARRRQLEAELHHAQKLESIGSLAGGVAHDMNNILGAIQAIVQTLQLKRQGDAGLLADLAILERASNRGRDLVKGLTNFVRKELEEPEPIDLNALVREEVELLGRTVLQQVELVTELAPALPAVMGERGALGAVVMNLCVNALDAMPETGTLTLRTRCRPDGAVELELADTGKGMPPEVLARAMEPFFTTKAVGKGTGLGLALVYATVKAHGGSVDLRSEVDRGTTVRVRLPAAGRAPDPAGAAPRTGPAGALRILQVDDDDLILASIPFMLRFRGHTVETAAGGQEALALLRGGLAVDLVLLDLNMPGMNGLETLRHLRELRPGLPVLLATGFLDPDTEARLKQFGNALSIAKPFSMDDLDAMLSRLAQSQEPA